MKLSRNTVEKKVKEYWPEQVDKIMVLLDTFATSCEHDSIRVQLAALKLAKGSQESLRGYLDQAKLDYRDVLAGAEYPHAMNAHHLIGFNLTPRQQQERKVISKLDRDQYLSWLEDGPKFDSKFENESVGLHLYSNHGFSHTFINGTPNEIMIMETLDKLNWKEFHQVALVKWNGESLEVGGSLNPIDGLTSTYKAPGITLVTESPPKTIEDLKFILCSFHREDGHWKKNYAFV